MKMPVTDLMINCKLSGGSTETMYYVLNDYLGSITAITEEDGNLVESLSFDPWGRRRNPEDWTDYNIHGGMFDRGYTGHEHLDQFGLINMNGRVYDPFLARFLSPDPFVQAPGYSQNYNRYSYAWNNPLRFIDPSGFINQYPDEGPITFYMDSGGGGGGSAPNWYPFASGGRFGPGSNKHWSAEYRSVSANFIHMSPGAFQNYYGVSSWNYNTMIVPNYKHLPQKSNNFNMKDGVLGFYGPAIVTASSQGPMVNDNGVFTVNSELYVTSSWVPLGTSGRVAANGGGDFDDIPMHPAVGMGQRIVGIADGFVGSTEYNLMRRNGNFLIGNPKCNKFVYDVTLQAGASPGLPNQPGRSDMLRGATGARPPVVSQWADPNYSIPGWVTVSIPMPGDVASFQGHVGIVYSNGLSISATLSDGVVRNDWGFRPGQAPVFRRFVGY